MPSSDKKPMPLTELERKAKKALEDDFAARENALNKEYDALCLKLAKFELRIKIFGDNSLADAEKAEMAELPDRIAAIKHQIDEYPKEYNMLVSYYGENSS